MTHILKKTQPHDPPPYLLMVNGQIIETAASPTRRLRSTYPVLLVTEYILDVTGDYLFDVQTDIEGYPIQAA